jgi:hypothetical protein
MDLVTSGLALLCFYTFISYIRFLLPRNIVPCVARALNETQQLLHRAEAIGAIPDGEEMRTCLEM